MIDYASILGAITNAKTISELTVIRARIQAFMQKSGGVTRENMEYVNSLSLHLIDKERELNRLTL